MFYHKICRGQLMIRVNDSFTLYASPSLGDNHILVTQFNVKINIGSNVERPADFWCPICDESHIDMDDILIQCSHCGEFLDVRSAFTFEGVPGVYCEEFANTFEEINPEKERKVVLPTIRKFRIRRP